MDSISPVVTPLPGMEYQYYSGDCPEFQEFERHMFDDEDDHFSRRHKDLRSHLDDLAKRHPEFADHLRSPPGWVSDFHSGGWGERERSNSGDRYFNGTEPQSETQGEDKPNQGEASSQNPPPSNSEDISTNRGPPDVRDGLNQHGLRNTDPDIGKKSPLAAEVRNQRSMSAPPPDSRTQEKPQQQRFVSKIEINPINPATGLSASDSAGKPPMAPPKQPQQNQNAQQTAQPQPSQQSQQRPSTVRHIPIFVEGRDEPVLPKNLDQEFSAPPRQQTFQQSRPPPQQQQTFQQQTRPPPHPQQQQHFYQQSAAPPPPPPQPQSQEKQPEPKNNPNDPIFRVQQIQKDVNELRKQVEQYKGNTKSDKEYLYLDEMLTRNLIKLDDIVAEGNENIRAARKEAIKSIQQCINLLESKIPAPDGESNQNQKMDVDNQKEGSQNKELEEPCTEDTSQTMETDQTSEGLSKENGESKEKGNVETEQTPLQESGSNSSVKKEEKC